MGRRGSFWIKAGLLVAAVAIGDLLLFDKNGLGLNLGVLLTVVTLALAFAALMGLLGLAVGLTYYGSIYYSLEFGEEKGQGGGRHEAVLGLGILAGPLVGAIATHLTGHVEGGKTAILGLSVLVTLFITARYARRPAKH